MFCGRFSRFSSSELLSVMSVKFSISFVIMRYGLFCFVGIILFLYFVDCVFFVRKIMGSMGRMYGEMLVMSLLSRLMMIRFMRFLFLLGFVCFVGCFGLDWWF